METNHKKFKCKDEILLKRKVEKSAVWFYAVFSHYCKNNSYITLSGGVTYDLGVYDIFPYEGNEHLLGTTDEPDEEVKLKDGECIVCSDFILNLKNNSKLYLAQFVRIEDNTFVTNHDEQYYYVIRLSDFNPNDLEETKKHILCANYGKVVRL